MLTIQLASDLHLELHKDAGTSFVQSMDPAGVDLLVLAGDILSFRFPDVTKRLFKILSEKYPQIAYVPGNHEFWRLWPDEALKQAQADLAGFSNVMLCNNRVFSIRGRRFIAGPMWFPRWSPLLDARVNTWPDFKEIQGGKEWAVKENTAFRNLLEKNLKPGDIVLTHHLPSFKSISPRFIGDEDNSFFVSEMDQIILDRKPELWVHGHTHDSHDYTLFNTRIVCNPFGYPKQLNSRYAEKMLISIG